MQFVASLSFSQRARGELVKYYHVGEVIVRRIHGCCVATGLRLMPRKARSRFITKCHLMRRVYDVIIDMILSSIAFELRLRLSPFVTRVAAAGRSSSERLRRYCIYR